MLSRASVIAAGSLVVLAALVALLALDPASWFAARPTGNKLVVFCAAGLKAPVARVAREYEEKYGVEVQLQYGGSNTLLASLQVSPLADVYIPADDSYATLARDKGLIAEVLPLASMKPVLAVRKGNPRKLADLDAVLKADVKLSHANPEAAAVGKLTRDALIRGKKWDAYAKKIVVQKPTVNDVAADVQIGAADAGFVWDVTLKQVPEIEAIPAGDLPAANLTACIVKTSEQPTAALRFARFLAASDAGAESFAEEGYTPAGGDPWEPTPELRLLAGAMLRPAVEKTITAFEEREGVRVTRVYNGCGILVAQMKADGPPDAFFACDREFLDQVGDLFGPGTTVSSNQLVILVQKGNPHGIKKLKDLSKPGLRVGIGHEKQCAMGVLTQRTLKEDRSTEAVMKNVKVQSPTGDMLVNQMLTGSLDAVIAYITNAAGHAERLEALAISIPCAFADQPFAVGKESRHRFLAGRLLDAIRAEDSRRTFEENGFTWKVR
jgi:molybdate transport system substrate-binding protein